MAQRKRFVEPGQRFGRGVVVDPEVRVRSGKREVRGARLRCDCGEAYEVYLQSLLSGATRSCGCLAREEAARAARLITNRPGVPRKLLVEAGQRFGRGVVIDPEISTAPTPSTPKGRRGARLRCDCGNEYEASLVVLLAGDTQSCGCYQREQKAKAARTPEARKIRRRNGRLVSSRPEAVARRRSPENLERLARWARSAENREQLAEWLRSPEGREHLERRRQFWLEYWSVLRAGSDHEPLEGPGYVECIYCDPPRRIPEERWEGHWSRYHEPRLEGRLTS
jgi:hypothetical protein